MYKLLIVDDEEIERIGMAECIPWEQYDIELAGTAWNGVDALRQMEENRPDIVLTDIKMPVMDGIELIRKVRGLYPEIEFIVLSGYGEYEFTSQAMSEGIRYYILKPCDEKKIMEVIEKVKDEIDEKRRSKEKAEDYRTAVRRFLPRVKEQLLRNLLLQREPISEGDSRIIREIGDVTRGVIVLSLRSEEPVDYLEQFIMGNVLGELLGDGRLLMSTFIEKDVLFLLDAECRERVKDAVERTIREFARVKPSSFRAAVSEEDELKNVNRLYRQIQELYRIGSVEHRHSLLCYEMFEETKEEASALIAYQKINQTDDFAEILFEVYLAGLKMKLKDYGPGQMEEMFGWALRVLYGEAAREYFAGGGETERDRASQSRAERSAAEGCRTDRNMSDWDGAEGRQTERGGANRGWTYLSTTEESSEYEARIRWKLVERTVAAIVKNKELPVTKDKEMERVCQILTAMYEHIDNPHMSIKYLAKEVLFMNEDYFGRLFVRSRNMKFSAFVLEQRIRLAQKLMQYDPDVRIAQIAELVGYSPDGQYFSKAFRKIIGKTPSEYREELKLGADEL